MEEYKEIFGKLAVPPLVLLLLLAGSVLSSYGFLLSRDSELITGMVLIVAVTAMAPVILKRIPAADDRYDKARRMIHRVLLALMAGAVIIAPALQVRDLAGGTVLSGHEGSFRGTVTSVREHRYSRELHLEMEGRGNGTVRAAAFAGYDREFHKGQRIIITDDPLEITMKRAEENPFDLLKLRKGIRHVFFLKPGNYTLSGGNKSPLRKSVREKITARVDALFPGKAGRVIKALYFGNKNYIDKKTLGEYKRAGVLHVLAASGLHVGIIASIPFFLLGLTGIPKKYIFTATLVILAAYLYITDMPVSLVRACLMFAVFALQKILDMEGNVFSTLFIAAIVILLISPYDLYSLGFQLSFGATLGILLFFNRFRETVSFLPKPVAAPMAVTLSAQVAVIPIILFRLNEINFIGIVSNVVVVPGTALVLISSICAGCASFLSQPLGGALASATGLIFQGNTMAVGFLAGLKGHFTVPDAGFFHLAPLALLLAPLVPLDSMKKTGTAAVFTAYLAGWSLSAMARPAVPGLSELPFNPGLEVHEGRDTVAVSGSLSGRDEADKLAAALEQREGKDVTLHITDPGYWNVMNFTRVIKKVPVSRCSIVTHRKNRAVRKLENVLARDRLELEVRSVSAGGDRAIPFFSCPNE